MEIIQKCGGLMRLLLPKRTLLTLVVLLASSISFGASFNTTISSAGIIENTLAGLSSCSHYEIKGICFWLKCEGICRVETTLNVDQYLPDEVETVFSSPTNDPWDFASIAIDPAANVEGQAQMKANTGHSLSDGASHDNSSTDMNNRFHEVDIVGNPALLLLNTLPFMITSAAIPYVPYYSSLLDAYAWRFPALERFYPGSLIPGIHEVGTLVLHDWGPVYPRNGYVNQPDDAKAAAVNALRASTIITSTGAPHVYNPLSNSCGKHCVAIPVSENSPLTQYQMIYPIAQNQCVVFGSSDITSLQPWETAASMAGNNRYVWVMWRHYSGCIQDHGATYLGSV